MTDSRPVRKKKARLLRREERRRSQPKPTPMKPPTPEVQAILTSWGWPPRIFAQKRQKTCGAKTRKGEPCKCLALANGRCKLHGGQSTGPKTEDGWSRTRAGYRAYVERRKAQAVSILTPRRARTGL